MNASRSLLVAVGLVAVLGLLAGGFAACGRKDDPRAASLVRPERIGDLAAATRDGHIRLEWGRPREYTGGDRMNDLGGFYVFRGQPGAAAGQLAEIPVSDRDRFRRETRFEYVDRDVRPGATYYYRIVSFTTDGYYSEPSNQQTVTVGAAEPARP